MIKFLNVELTKLNAKQKKHDLNLAICIIQLMTFQNHPKLHMLISLFTIHTTLSYAMLILEAT